MKTPHDLVNHWKIKGNPAFWECADQLEKAIKGKVVVDREDLKTLKKENILTDFDWDVMGWFFDKYLPQPKENNE